MIQSFTVMNGGRMLVLLIRGKKHYRVTHINDVFFENSMLMKLRTFKELLKAEWARGIKNDLFTLENNESRFNQFNYNIYFTPQFQKITYFWVKLYTLCFPSFFMFFSIKADFNLLSCLNGFNLGRPISFLFCLEDLSRRISFRYMILDIYIFPSILLNQALT